MAEYNLAVIAGDGIGPEVISEGRKVLDAVAAQTDGLFFRVTEYPWGSDYYRETGRMMPEDGLEQLSNSDAVLFGAVGDPNIPDHVTLQGLLLPIAPGLRPGHLRAAGGAVPRSRIARRPAKPSRRRRHGQYSGKTPRANTLPSVAGCTRARPTRRSSRAGCSRGGARSGLSAPPSSTASGAAAGTR